MSAVEGLASALVAAVPTRGGGDVIGVAAEWWTSLDGLTDPRVVLGRDGDELTPAGARELAAALLSAADVADGGQQR